MIISRNKILSAVLSLSVLICAQASGFTLGKDAAGRTMYWDKNSMPLAYSINVSGVEEPTASERVREVTKAFDSWEKPSISTVSFKYSGLTEISSPAYDGVNVVIWVKEGWTHRKDAVAYTTLWVTGTGQIVDADIELNEEKFKWSSDGTPGTMDIRNAVAHEVGHFLGAGHSIEALDVSMFPVISEGELVKRLVKGDDFDAAAFLYPVSSTEVEVFGIPDAEFLGEYAFPEKLETNYESLSDDERLLMISGMNRPPDGAGGLAVFFDDEDKGFYIYPSPGMAGEKLTPFARDSWEISKGVICDLAAVDIDADGVDEIAVLRMTDIAEQALYIYDSPPEGSFDRAGAKMWVARDLWRIPGKSDNLMVFGLDMDADGRKELATISYSKEGIYTIKVFTAPFRSDYSEEDAEALGDPITIPFTINGAVIDIDCIDVNHDGVSELVALVKDDDGYSMKVLPLTLPDFPEEVRELKPILTMPLVVDPGEHPFGITIITGKGLSDTRIVVVSSKTE